MIQVNARFRKQKITGVQRYAVEICDRLTGQIREVIPEQSLEGPKAHLWEQCILPLRLRKGVLWNPCATGPLCRRSVVTVHDVAFLDHPEWFSRDFGLLYREVVPRVARSAHHVICVSEYTRERLVAWTGISSNRISVISSGPATLGAPLPREQEQAFLHRLDLLDRPFLLSVGSMDPRKNLARLLRAWERAKSLLPLDAALVLVGGGRPSVFANEFQAPDPPGVVRTGYISDAELRTLYSTARAFIYPSLYEGFGLPPLEAMQAGCPVVVSSATSLPEVVGEAGCYVDPLSEASISSAIELVFSDESWRTEMIAKGRDRAAGFSWDSCAKAVQKILMAYET